MQGAPLTSDKLEDQDRANEKNIQVTIFAGRLYNFLFIYEIMPLLQTETKKFRLQKGKIPPGK